MAVVSIAHLADAQRMAFVTLLAGPTVSWMRSQGGTSSLKALFLMDEVFGYVPPTANPPSKTPILTLLKQARAYGLGVVLATQNPVDLDYKGLSNAGLWFLGRLQTARDKARVLDGLEGAAQSAGGSFDRGRLDTLLSGLEQRRFLMHSVHGDEETLFQTPLDDGLPPRPAAPRGDPAAHGGRAGAGAADRRPPPRRRRSRAVGPRSAARRAAADPAARRARGVSRAAGPRAGRGGACCYEPAILGRARVRYAKPTARIDVDREVDLPGAGGRLARRVGLGGRPSSSPSRREVEPAPRTGVVRQRCRRRSPARGATRRSPPR